MRHYETIFIVNPTLVEESYREVVNKFTNLIEKQKGVIVKVEEWGNQRLAYKVRKFDKGFYVIFNYCGGTGVTSEVERDLKLDDRILKYQTIKLSDDVDPQQLILKEKEAKRGPEVKEPQETPTPQPMVQESSQQPAQEVKSDV